ncbi:MAG: RES domain-containing protein [Chromatiaceae bacterium]|nr:RES domain-containing protein [Chromatiaceae bacterium]
MKAAALAQRFAGTLFRAHNPRWAFAPTSGAGAARFGGRFNRPGLPALYTSLTPKTAWMEAQQGFPFKAQPLTLVAYQVDCAAIVDLTKPEVIATLGVDGAILACPWEDIASRGQPPPTWGLADGLVAAGCQGALVPSFAPGTDPGDLNLVLWTWSDTAPCRVEVVDDFGRLPRDDASWR